MAYTMVLIATVCGVLLFTCFSVYYALLACTKSQRRRLRDEYEPELTRRSGGAAESMALLGKC